MTGADQSSHSFLVHRTYRMVVDVDGDCVYVEREERRGSIAVWSTERGLVDRDGAESPTLSLTKEERAAVAMLCAKLWARGRFGG